MASTEIRVSLGRGREVTVRGEAIYKGTIVQGVGRPNVETYDCTIRGIACEGRWYGDGRQPVVVEDCPRELRPLLMAEYRAQASARARADARAARAAEVRFYGRALDDYLS